VAEFQYRN